jgi:hypothetical protein
MRIFDCFTFYNELDLLELRLTELYNKVDQFVIVEATTTFTNRTKPVYFEQNRSRYKKWADKITHIKVELPQDPDTWTNETYQRNAILQGIQDADSNDMIVISDVDEVLRPEAVDLMRAGDQTIYACRMPIFNFKFNYMRATPGQYDVWAMAARRHVFDQITPNSLRSMRFNFFDAPHQHVGQGCQVIEHAGWHFGYLGDNEYLRDKAQSFSHQEVNTPDFIAQIDVEQSIAERKEWNRAQPARYEIIDLDDYFPKSVHQYQDRILPDSGIRAVDLLPAYPYNK